MGCPRSFTCHLDQGWVLPLGSLRSAQEPEVGILPSRLPLCIPFCHQNPLFLRTSSAYSPKQDTPALTPLAHNFSLQSKGFRLHWPSQAVQLWTSYCSSLSCCSDISPLNEVSPVEPPTGVPQFLGPSRNPGPLNAPAAPVTPVGLALAEELGK